MTRTLHLNAFSSEAGKDFAARYAEAAFTARQTLAEAQAFYRDFRAAYVPGETRRGRYGLPRPEAARVGSQNTNTHIRIGS